MTPPSSRRLAVLRRALSKRDQAVLDDLAHVRLLTVRQLQRLHLETGSSLTRARRTRATMERLHRLGVVTRLDRRVGGVHAGSAGHVYGLSSTGQRLTTGVGPAGGRRARRPWEPSLPFVDHLLMVSELYVRLREAERTSVISGLRFEAEPACWRRWTSVAGEQLIVKPDAYARFERGGYEHRFFIEVDRATQSSTVIRRKGMVYVDYFRSGVEQAHSGLFPRVLFVTTDDARRGQLVEALTRLDADDWQLFQAQTDAEAFADLLRAPPD
jgi:Replication-relaxation